MNRFRKILAYVPADDERMLALEQAASLARETDAGIQVLGILHERGTFSSWRPRSTREILLRKLLEEGQREQIERRAAELRDEGLCVEVDIRWGTPWLEIVRTVLLGGFDLVVKAAEGAERSQGLFFGSTALHLIRKCPCPVWVVGRASAARDLRVLAAIDPEEDATRAAIAGSILELANELAGSGGELHAVTAWRAAGETLLQNRMNAGDLAGYVEAELAMSRAGLERAAAMAGIPLLPENLHLKKGEPADVLPRLVEELGIDLLVMGSLGRVGIAGILIGETAESIIRSVRCSTLVVKPPGFVSPVAV